MDPTIVSHYPATADREGPARIFARFRSDTGLFDIVAIVGLVLATLFIFRLAPDYRDGIFVAAALFGFAFAVRNFPFVWMMFLVEVPIIQLHSSIFDQTKISWTRFLMVGFALVFLVSRKPPAFWRSVSRQLAFIGLVLFVAANMLSAFRLLDVEAMTRSLAYGEPALIFLITYYAASMSPENSRRMLRAILISGLFIMGLGLVEFVTQKSILDLMHITTTMTDDAEAFLLADRYGFGGRISSLYAQPVYAATGFFIYGIVCSYYLLIYRPNIPRFVRLLAVGTGTFLMFITGSRGPVIAMVPTLLVFGIFRRSKNLIGRLRNATLLLVGFGILVYGLIASDLMPEAQDYWARSFNLTSYESSGLSGRIDLTRTLLDLFKENPIFGYGPGLAQKSAFAGSAKLAGISGLENHYAVILADGGLVAGSMYLLFMVGVFVMLIRVLRGAEKSEAAHYALLSLLVFTFVFASATSASFLGGPIIDLVMAVFAITVVAYDTWRNQPTRSSNMAA